jgi:nucleoside-diphosphate-sugar epimerase
MNTFFTPQFSVASQNHLGVWRHLAGAKIFLTGGTGFFGKWLLEIMSWANETQNTNLKVYLLSRDPDQFKKSYPRLCAAPWLTLIKGDVTSFEFPKIEVTHVIHAATSASTQLNNEEPLIMIDTIVQGTRRVLEFAQAVKAKRFLLTSSGGTYGAQPSNMSHFPEDYMGGPDPLRADSAYGEGKRLAEFLCSVSYHKYGLESVIARCFAFVGPYLPLDTHFAVGNFIRDAMSGSTIHIAGDGTPHRSYLYGADMAQWLFTLLAFGQPIRAYHVGSESSLSIFDIASTVADTIGRIDNRKVAIQVAKKSNGGPPSKYVPFTERSRTEFKLQENFSLAEAIELTVKWHRSLA